MSNISITNSNYNEEHFIEPTYQRPSFIDRVEQVATPLLFTSMTALGTYVATLSSVSEGVMVAGLGSSLLCFLGGMTSAIRQKPDAGKWMLGGLLGSTASLALLNDRTNLIQQNHHLADAYNQVRNQLEILEAQNEPYISSQCQTLLDGCQKQGSQALEELSNQCTTALDKTIVDYRNHMETVQDRVQNECNTVLKEVAEGCKNVVKTGLTTLHDKYKTDFGTVQDLYSATFNQLNTSMGQVGTAMEQTITELSKCQNRLQMSMAQTEEALIVGQKCAAGVQEVTAQMEQITTLINKH